MRLYTLLVIFLISQTLDQAAADSVTLTGVDNYNSLKDAIYTELNGGDACVRILTNSGTLGCGASSKSSITGVLTRVDSSTPPSTLPDNAVVLLAPQEAGAFLTKCSINPDACLQVTGALIEYSSSFPGWNSAAKFPQAQFANYYSKLEDLYQWNPLGNNIASTSFAFPIFQLDNETTISAQQRVAQNQEQDMQGALNIASMELYMEGSVNTSSCIASRTCLPLGGHSVWGSIGSSNKETIMVLANVDSTGLFHQLTQAANYPVSGLIATLAAAEILGNATAAANPDSIEYTKQIVFNALRGEPWGYMGSKRMLWTMFNNSDDASVQGLDVNAMSALVEVGAVASTATAATGELFMHVDKSSSQSTTATEALLTAIEQAATSLLKVSRAAASTPGLPPSSSSSFLRIKPDIPTVYLADYNQQYTDARYQTQWDTVDTLNTSTIVNTAATLARALHQLALSDDDTNKELPINIEALTDTVAQLVDCLAVDIATCSMAQTFMTPTASSSSHYIGILRTTMADAQIVDPNVHKDVERFIWNFLAFATRGIRPDSIASIDIQRCRPSNATSCPSDTVCAGFRDNIAGVQGTGYCLPSIVRYVPSYSTSLECQGCNGTATVYQPELWTVSDGAREWEAEFNWPIDAMYTESNWPTSTPSLTLYQKESDGAVVAVLLAGVCTTVAMIVGVVAVRAAYFKRLKQM